MCDWVTWRDPRTKKIKKYRKGGGCKNPHCKNSDWNPNNTRGKWYKGPASESQEDPPAQTQNTAMGGNATSMATNAGSGTQGTSSSSGNHPASAEVTENSEDQIRLVGRHCTCHNRGTCSVCMAIWEARGVGSKKRQTTEGER